MTCLAQSIYHRPKTKTMNVLIFTMGVATGILLSLIILRVVVHLYKPQRVKIAKRGRCLTEHWYSGITRDEMKNYVN